MDVKQYYKKINEIEAGLQDLYPVVVSLETSDGGKPGVLSEVSRPIAAKMIVEGRVVVASAAEKEQYREKLELARKAAEKAELARRLQVTIVSDSDLKPSLLSKKNNDPASSGK